MKKEALPLMALSMLFFHTSFAEQPDFSDIQGHWGKAAISWAIQNNMVKGYSNGTFKPNQSVTEAEFLSMLIRIFPNSRKELENMEQEGQARRYWSDYFYHVANQFNIPIQKNRDIAITRGQVAQMIAGSFGKNYSVEGAIAFLYDTGLSYGRGAKTIEGFEADDSLTRTEAVQLLKGIQENKLASSMVKRSEIPELNPNVRKYKPRVLQSLLYSNIGSYPNLSNKEIQAKVKKEKEETINLNYGKYGVPQALTQIIALQNDLRKAGMLPYGDLLGYYFSLEGLESRYLNTPLDVIPFARPGVDGIHYGFLTDFGSVEDLYKAYIVRVSPMDFDEPVKIVARNIHDFMRILCYTPVVLDFLDMSMTEEDYKKWGEKYPELSFAQLDLHDEVNVIFKEKFQLVPIPNIFSYL